MALGLHQHTTLTRTNASVLSLLPNSSQRFDQPLQDPSPLHPHLLQIFQAHSTFDFKLLRICCVQLAHARQNHAQCSPRGLIGLQMQTGCIMNSRLDNLFLAGMLFATHRFQHKCSAAGCWCAHSKLCWQVPYASQACIAATA